MACGKATGCYAGHHEVGRCHTRGKSQRMYIMYVSMKCEYGFETLEETSPEVQTSGISDPTKRTYVLQTLFKKL